MLLAPHEEFQCCQLSSMEVLHGSAPGCKLYFCPKSTVELLQVDDSGKVTRLKQTCPNCGPGIFMANHFDRNYWCADVTRYCSSCISLSRWQFFFAAKSIRTMDT